MPPIAVNWTSAGFPHHSQRLPRGAVSTETGRLNSFSIIKVSSWVVLSKYNRFFAHVRGKPVSGGQQRWRIHGDTAHTRTHLIAREQHRSFIRQNAEAVSIVDADKIYHILMESATHCLNPALPS